MTAVPLRKRRALGKRWRPSSDDLPSPPFAVKHVGSEVAGISWLDTGIFVFAFNLCRPSIPAVCYSKYVGTAREKIQERLYSDRHSTYDGV